MKKEISMIVNISVDEVLDMIPLGDALEWYKKDLGKEAFAEILREKLDLL